MKSGLPTRWIPTAARPRDARSQARAVGGMELTRNNGWEEGIGELAEIEAKDQTREIDMRLAPIGFGLTMYTKLYIVNPAGDSFDRGVGLADESIKLCIDKLVGSENRLDFVPGSSPVTTRRYILRRIRLVPQRGKYWWRRRTKGGSVR